MKKLICDKLHSNLGLEQCVVLKYPVIWEATYTIKPSEFRTGMAWKALVWEGLHHLQWFQSLHNSQCFRRSTHTQGKLMELEQHPLMAYSEDLWIWKFWSFSHQLLASTSGNPEIPPPKKNRHPCHPPQGTSGITRQLRMKCQPAGMLQETWQETILPTRPSHQPGQGTHPLDVDPGLSHTLKGHMRWIGFWRSYFLVGYCRGVG